MTTEQTDLSKSLEEAFLRWEWFPDGMNKEFEAIKDRLEKDLEDFSHNSYEEIQKTLREAVLRAFDDYFSEIWWGITYPTVDDILISPGTMHPGGGEETGTAR